MLRIRNQNNQIKGNKGQNAVEYLLVFILVIIVIVAALAPNGFMTQAIDNSFNIAVTGMINIVNSAWP